MARGQEGRGTRADVPGRQTGTEVGPQSLSAVTILAWRMESYSQANRATAV